MADPRNVRWSLDSGMIFRLKLQINRVNPSHTKFSMQNIIRSDASESPFGIQQLRPASDPAIGRIRSHALSKIV